MEPKEIAQTFTEVFSLDFHDFYDVVAWKEERVIKLDYFKFEAWFVSRFGESVEESSLRSRVEYEYGKRAAEFIHKII